MVDTGDTSHNSGTPQSAELGPGKQTETKDQHQEHTANWPSEHKELDTFC